MTTPAYRTPLKDLFPEIEPYSSGYLSVGGGHELYWEQSGNPNGAPVIFLHGGPGAGTTSKHRRFFDPDAYRIILFDQRGAGKSHPHASTENNTLGDLVEDMEKLRTHLKVDQWHVFGGSWGSTLALAYATTHPSRCKSLILRGIFLLEHAEVDWMLNGVQKLYPEAWETMSNFIPEAERGDLLNAYYRRLMSDDIVLQTESAMRWAYYEGSLSALIPEPETIITPEQKAEALALARMEAHYFKHQLISPENSLLKQVDKIRHIPGVIVHGRYDCVCPLEAAYRLHLAWPEADFIIVPDAGHSSSEPGIRSRLIEATEAFKTL